MSKSKPPVTGELIKVKCPFGHKLSPFYWCAVSYPATLNWGKQKEIINSSGVRAIVSIKRIDDGVYKIWARVNNKCYGPLVAWRSYAIKWDHPAPPLVFTGIWFNRIIKRYIHDVRTMAERHYRIDTHKSKHGGLPGAPWCLNLNAVIDWCGEYLIKDVR